MLKAQKAKPPLCHALPAKYSSVTVAVGIMESIFDELQVILSCHSSFIAAFQCYFHALNATENDWPSVHTSWNWN